MSVISQNSYSDFTMSIWLILLILLISLGFIFTCGLIVLGVPQLRQRLVTIEVFKWFKTVLPPMSSTEKQAISAGDTWYEAELFQGKPNWTKLLANPKPTLTAEENKFLENQVEILCSMLDEWQITNTDHDVPNAVWNYIKTAGFFGLHVPKEYGGLEFSALASSTIVQKIATKSLSVAVTVMVPNSLGPAELILHYGTDGQKQKYLHKLAKGVEMPCFALTAPDAGSDATSITDEGIICYGDFAGQKNVLGIRLNWNKRYITLAPAATLIGLAVKLKDPDKILSATTELGITVVLVPHDLPGIEIGKRHFPLNQAFLNGPTRGNNVFLPLDHIVGGQGMIGKGWQMLVECLAAGRGISLPALSTATGKHCFRTCGAYAKLRQQFNVSIGKFEGVATALARIGGFTYMLEATRLLTLSAIDQKIKPSVVTAISKYHMTEMARQVINDAMDIHGGRGIMLGPRNYLARIYEGIPISITVEGANILTRCLMIFGQGAIRCHPYVRQEMDAANNPDSAQGLKNFDQVLCKHVWYSFANISKLNFHSYTANIFCAAPDKTMWRKYYQRLSFMSLALACLADMAMLFLGGNLKRKENLSARLGDVLSYLYIASAVLKFNHDNGEPEDEKPFVQWCLDFCLYNIQQSFVQFLLNFPNKLIAKPMQWLIFPPWRNYRLPQDELAIELSRIMMSPSELRDRLTTNCISSTDSADAVGRIEMAWLKMNQVEPLLAKIDDAVKQGLIAKSYSMQLKIKLAVDHKVLTIAEAEALTEFEDMRLDAMQVDEFTTQELIGKRS
jgi:acyl-CoA dehydrogenase